MKFQINEKALVVNARHPKYQQIGKYAGLADVVDGVEQKHRISFGGEIYLCCADEFELA